MKKMITLLKRCLQLFILGGLFIVVQGSARKPAGPQLDRMPVKLETDYALSSLPPQLRAGATVYLLDPAKGYYIARKGTNGFICFISRTEWQWAEFRNDVCTPISYDAEGARTIFPVYMDVAAMRASGKYTPVQVKNIVIDRVKKGIYKGPGRAGVSYMLAPVMRVYTGNADNNTVMTMEMPHYMFYAPHITNTDLGNIPNGQADGPFVSDPSAVIFGQTKSPYGLIIVPAGEKEAAKIVADNKDLLKRLGDYRAFMRVPPAK